ncbi:gentisate 1,2-dioxygenase [Janthinobacterium sp. 17J80-10]|uniref:gentisate 1,2-dioxygenase n=1 Tax=Janthinobacterium sp. 17J80-10 TaxID=2497863 RepID=UPI0010058F75|nr:gentisate 1,2-dioxygenase [Janthinobacterium sp. 17J80-10]QAU35623.1 gentisate 1,2-dioxygenase [Janthinobacterium sp. 17J80-10]
MHAQTLPQAVRDERQQFYQRISASNLTPLWEVLGALVPPTPRTDAVAAGWRYAEIREQIMEAGRLITAEEAERRVLILENPALRGQSAITSSLYAGLQLILPGEVAPAHRHSQSALRLVLDGEGAYTAVDGERTTMRRGDFIITPSWTFHDHGNLGNEPVVWLDGLDIPTVRFYGAGFAEPGRAASQQAVRPEGDALARFGNNMVPVDFYQTPDQPTKVFVYPFAKTRASLLAVAETPADPHFGHKFRFVNPATGASPMPTIGAFAQRLAKGCVTRPYRSTDGTVYACLEGGGTAQIGDQTFEFAPNDVFVVPSWHALELRAKEDTILFSYSDRPCQQALGLWREEKI